MCALGTMYCAPTMESAESGVGTQEALAWGTGTDLSPPLHGMAQPSFLSLFLTGPAGGFHPNRAREHGEGAAGFEGEPLKVEPIARVKIRHPRKTQEDQAKTNQDPPSETEGGAPSAFLWSGCENGCAVRAKTIEEELSSCVWPTRPAREFLGLVDQPMMNRIQR